MKEPVEVVIEDGFEVKTTKTKPTIELNCREIRIKMTNIEYELDKLEKVLGERDQEIEQERKRLRLGCDMIRQNDARMSELRKQKRKTQQEVDELYEKIGGDMKIRQSLWESCNTMRAELYEKHEELKKKRVEQEEEELKDDCKLFGDYLQKDCIVCLNPLVNKCTRQWPCGHRTCEKCGCWMSELKQKELLNIEQYQPQIDPGESEENIKEIRDSLDKWKKAEKKKGARYDALHRS